MVLYYMENLKRRYDFIQVNTQQSIQSWVHQRLLTVQNPFKNFHVFSPKTTYMSVSGTPLCALHLHLHLPQSQLNDIPSTIPVYTPKDHRIFNHKQETTLNVEEDDPCLHPGGSYTYTTTITSPSKSWQSGSDSLRIH